MSELTNLPQVPSGWMEDSVPVGEVTFKIARPSQPDELLDDESVRKAHATDGYMPYWAYLWPCSISMAEWIMREDWEPGRRVLEIGCGLGLVGLAALSKGLRMTLTDYDAKAVEVALDNARRNGFQDVQVKVLDWRRPSNERFEIVLACDVLYETRHHRPIWEFLDSVLEDSGTCWLGDPKRQHALEFERLAGNFGFEINVRFEVSADGNPVDDQYAQRGTNNFRLLEIKRLRD